MNVTALCRELDISRQTLYKYRRRFEAEGPAWLVERSPRPHSSPGRVSLAIEEAIVLARKALPVQCGAQTIAYHLERSGQTAPSVATIHRILVRRGMVTTQPEKRPKIARNGSRGRDPTTRGRSTQPVGHSPTARRSGSWTSWTTTPAPWSPPESIPDPPPKRLGRRSPALCRTGVYLLSRTNSTGGASTTTRPDRTRLSPALPRPNDGPRPTRRPLGRPSQARLGQASTPSRKPVTSAGATTSSGSTAAWPVNGCWSPHETSPSRSTVSTDCYAD